MADFGTKRAQHAGTNRVNYADPTMNSRRLEVPGSQNCRPNEKKPITPYLLKRRLQHQDPIQAEHGGQGPANCETTADYDRGAAGEIHRAREDHFAQPETLYGSQRLTSGFGSNLDPSIVAKSLRPAARKQRPASAKFQRCPSYCCYLYIIEL